MSASAPSDVPLPPLELITSTDQCGLVVLITSLLLGFVMLCFCARLYTRSYITGAWMRDDHVLTAATVVCCIESALVYAQASKGFGKSKTLLRNSDIVSIEEIGYAADLLYFLGLLFSKFSVSFLFLRLSPGRGHFRASWAAVAGSTIWAFMSLLLRTIHCNPDRPWSHLSTQCTDLLFRWQLICALDVITEAALFGISVYIVASLHMSLWSKATVVLVFSLRLPVIAASVVRLHYVKRAVYSSDPTLVGALVAVWTQVQLDYSIMAGTVSCLGPFMSPFSISLQEKRSPYATARSASIAHDLQPIVSTNYQPDKGVEGVHTSAGAGPVVDERIIRPDRFSHKTTISHGVRNDRPSTDSRQMIITKDMEWSVTIDRDRFVGSNDFPSQEVGVICCKRSV